MDGKKLVAHSGNLVVLDTAKSEQTRGEVLGDHKVGLQEKILIGEVISTSPFLLESGKWMDTPYKVGDYVVYTIHAGAGQQWQHSATNEKGSCIGVYMYRVIKWTEVLCKYNA